MAPGFFEGITQRDVKLARFEGKLPCLFRDLSSMLGVFSADAARVRELLPDPALQPVEARKGRAVLFISAVEYRESDVGPYNEVCIAAEVTFGHRPLRAVDVLTAIARARFEMFVLHQPVSTEAARCRASDVFGFPALLAGVRFVPREGFRDCVVTSPGGFHILTLSARERGHGRSRRLRLESFAAHRGELVRATTELNEILCASTLRRDAALLDIGSGHPIASELTALDIDPRPLAFQISSVAEAILHEPRPAREPLARTA